MFIFFFNIYLFILFISWGNVPEPTRILNLRGQNMNNKKEKKRECMNKNILLFKTKYIIMKNKTSIRFMWTNYKQKKSYKIIDFQYILNKSFLKMKFDILLNLEKSMINLILNSE